MRDGLPVAPEGRGFAVPLGTTSTSFHDCADLQGNALREIPAGFESDLRKAKGFEAALHDF
jgi:hypothetical protein